MITKTKVQAIDCPTLYRWKVRGIEQGKKL